MNPNKANSYTLRINGFSKSASPLRKIIYSPSRSSQKPGIYHKQQQTFQGMATETKGHQRLQSTCYLQPSVLQHHFTESQRKRLYRHEWADPYKALAPPLYRPKKLGSCLCQRILFPSKTQYLGAYHGTQIPPAPSYPGSCPPHHGHQRNQTIQKWSSH